VAVDRTSKLVFARIYRSAKLKAKSRTRENRNHQATCSSMPQAESPALIDHQTDLEKV
jgi:hypothetical protein